MAGASPTLLQKRAIEGLKAEILKPTGKSLPTVLVEAGYATESARQWTNIMEGIRPHLQPTLDWMEMHRAKVQAKMDEKIGTASYDELRKALEGLTTGIQLLGGKPTQNIAISAEVRHRLNEMIEN